MHRVGVEWNASTLEQRVCSQADRRRPDERHAPPVVSGGQRTRIATAEEKHGLSVRRPYRIASTRKSFDLPCRASADWNHERAIATGTVGESDVRARPVRDETPVGGEPGS